MSALSPLLEHERTQRGHQEIDAIDPTRTSGTGRSMDRSLRIYRQPGQRGCF